MWTRKDGRIKLDVEKIRGDFRIISEDGLRFISPKRSVWEWEDDERWLRSIVVDEDGFVVSSGWPKFGNYSEFKKDSEILDNALKNNEDVRFSHKEDGSLCIRSIIKDEVVFRSRGTFFGGGEEGFGNLFFKIAKEKYPKLLDPLWMRDVSLLFEYVSPENFIVIRYNKEDLIFIGAVVHDSLSICTWNQVEKISKEGNLNLVRLHNLPKDLASLLEEVKRWTDEGVVVRCNNDQTFVKIKSASYLFNHRKRFNLNYEVVVHIVEDEKVADKDQFINAMKKLDYDWETIKEAEGFYDRVLSVKEKVDNIVKTAEELNNMFWEDHDINDKSNPLIRKEFASFARVQVGYLRSIMFLLYDEHYEKLFNLCREIVLREKI